MLVCSFLYHTCSLRPEQFIHCWWVGGVSISWKQGRLMAEDALKGGKLGGWVPEWVLRIICPWEEASPILLIVWVNGPEESTNFLDGLLHLTIGLWVIPRGEADGHSVFSWSSSRHETWSELPGHLQCFLVSWNTGMSPLHAFKAWLKPKPPPWPLFQCYIPSKPEWRADGTASSTKSSSPGPSKNSGGFVTFVHALNFHSHTLWAARTSNDKHLPRIKAHS